MDADYPDAICSDRWDRFGVSRTLARTLLPITSILALLDSAAGTFYHARNIVNRPGGLKYPLYNLMYGSPLFAPLLLGASGFLGLLASLLRREE